MPELRARLEVLLARVHESASWRASLARFGWTDSYLTGRAFERFLDDEDRRIEAILLSLRSGGDVAPLERTGASVFPSVIGGGLLLVVGALLVERIRAKPFRATARAEHGNLRAVGILAAGAAASIVLLDTVGFLISSALLFWCTAWAFGSRRWGRDVAAGCAFALLVDVLFRRGLSLALPEGILKGLL
jgi:putative tricarboxylic transport membrane protein